ncbi:MAG: TonB-dependent siderophore receptor [bacterium]|nr:TonB-dependent siderophore receptor [bacterium]
MSKTVFSSLVFAALVLFSFVFITVPVLADTGAEPSAESEQTEGESNPGLTIEEELLVEDTAPYLPDTLQTATKSSTPLLRLPASASALSHSLLRDRNALVLGDALTNVPGVNAQSNSGVHDLFFIRGFESLSSSLVMTDGAPEPEATFYQLYNVERVEVVRGPAGFLYGGNPLAGAVNLVRKRPYGDVFTRFGALFGSHSTSQATLDFNYGAGNGSAGFRLNGMWQSSDGYRDDKASTVTAANPVFSFLAGDNTSVTISAGFLRSDFEPDAGIPLLFGEIPDVPRERSYQTPQDFSDQDLTRFRVEVESRLKPNLTLRNKTYLTVLDWDSKGTLLNAAFPNFQGGVDVFRTRTVLDDRQEFLGNQLDLLFSWQTGSVKHNFVTGLELARLTDELQLDIGLLPNIDLFNPVETAPESDFLIPQLGTTADAETTIVAPYLLDEIEVSGRWRLFLGGRFDSIDFEDSAVGLSNSDSQLSPFVGALFAPTETVSVYANYSEAFSPPSSTVAGSDRDPEEGRQYELGVKSEHMGGKLRTSLAFYHLEKDKIAIVDATGVTAQLGDQESEGFELEITSSPRERLHWTFSYAYTDAELVHFTEVDPFFFQIVDHSGNTPSYAPEHLANVWLSQRFLNGFGISGGARYVSEQFIDEDNAFEIDAYVTLDALLTYERDRWGARVHLRNLTDEEYEGRGFGGASVLPADGFNVMGGVHFNL